MEQETKPKGFKFQASPKLLELYNVWLKTLGTIHAEYYKQVTASTEESTAKSEAIGNMILLIDFIDSPEITISMSLERQEERDALKGILIDARKLREHMGADIAVTKYTEVEEQILKDE